MTPGEMEPGRDIEKFLALIDEAANEEESKIVGREFLQNRMWHIRRAVEGIRAALQAKEAEGG